MKWIISIAMITTVILIVTFLSKGVLSFWNFPYVNGDEQQNPVANCYVEIWEPKYIGKSECKITVSFNDPAKKKAIHKIEIRAKKINAKVKWINEDTIDVIFLYRGGEEVYQKYRLVYDASQMGLSSKKTWPLKAPDKN